MRWLLLLAPLAILAGCVEPGQPAPPPAGPLPPSLLIDHRADAGALQLFIRAKQGNVRYDFINVTVDGERVANRTLAYSAEEVLPRPEATLAVEVREADTVYAWTARVALNTTADEVRPTLTVAAEEEHGQFAAPRDFALPYEKLLPRQEEA